MRIKRNNQGLNSFVKMIAIAFLISPTLWADDVVFDSSKVIGTEAANCQKCHPSEVDHWKKTTHFISANRLEYAGNSKKYVDAMGIEPATLKSSSMCADCHATKAVVSANPEVISGVSCESCHGGAKDWLKPHAEYFAGQTFIDLKTLRADREKETAEHREARLATTADMGMIRPDMLPELTQNCLNCHLIDNEKLIIAGHKPASNFELTSWLNGEVRHNFFMDPKVNADAPSLWMEVHGATAQQRNRTKFVVGTMVQIQTALKRRATATNPAYVPQIGGIVAATNGRLAQINALSGTSETQAAAGVIAPLFGTLFAPLPTDNETYSAASDKIEEQVNSFIENHDGKDLNNLDSLLRTVPPHYSQQFKEKHLNK